MEAIDRGWGCGSKTLREKRLNLNAQESVQSRVRNFKVRQASAFRVVPAARVLTYLCFFVSSFFLWSPPSSRFKTWPQDSTSRSTHSGSLLFYSSDFCWSPFTFNMRESSYLKNLVHPGTVYSISSVNSNPSLKSFHWSSPLFWYTLHCLWGQFATTLPPSNLLYQSLLLSFVHYTLHHLILFPVNPLRHL